MFTWPQRDSFLNREAELGRLEQWWNSDDFRPINLFGRRRVGKSWLFRAFANEKPADFFVADQRAQADQLAQFANQFDDADRRKTVFDDITDFFQFLFRRSRQDRTIVVIDEFPYLCAVNKAVPSILQSVMEVERDDSQLKLILCGSQVAQMEDLLTGSNPLHGRLLPLHLRSWSFQHSQLFLKDHAPAEQISRFAIAGGMPLYLRSFGAKASLKKLLCDLVFDPLGPLFNEVRIILGQELSKPNQYFSILQAISHGSASLEQIVDRSRIDRNIVTKYLHVLQRLQIVQRRVPVTDNHRSARGRYRISDPFTRFWFRFVFPYQDMLETEYNLNLFYENVVEDKLTSHVSPVFEDIAAVWVRQNYGEIAQKVGSWWGPSLHRLRRDRTRTNEEIDIVGLSDNRATVLGECQWRKKPMDAAILHELIEYKIPALRQAGIEVQDEVSLLLFSRSGFTQSLQRKASQKNVRLINLEQMLGH